ncbi:glycosyltransferase family 4 protein [Arthrobacter crystallopoietes]|uniref:glycosyltransferase family 4 protein n=1 Tax=Crystallibacter crystallopoietes TaxID=37928 RepID=UPI003D243CA8
MMKRKLLMITKADFSKPMDGGTMRVSAVAKHLESLGFELEAIPVRDTEPQPTPRRIADFFPLTFAQVRVIFRILRIGSISVARWYSPRVVARIFHATRKASYSCAVVEYTQLLIYRPLLPGRVILDMHNVESELLSNYSGSTRSLFRKAIANYEAGRVRQIESTLTEYVDAVATVSSHDAQQVRRLNPEAKHVIVASNGVADSGFDTDYERQNTVVFVAHLGWQPNVDAAKWLAREVWPKVVAARPELKLQLVGRNPSPDVLGLASDTVEVHPNVKSVLEYVGSARVATAPLLAAGGTRLKILEALSCNTPVVATSLGALGLEDLISDSALAIADRAEDFAEQIIKFSSADDRGRGTSRQAVERYRWASTLTSLGDLVAKVGAEDDRATV